MIGIAITGETLRVSFELTYLFVRLAHRGLLRSKLKRRDSYRGQSCKWNLSHVASKTPLKDYRTSEHAVDLQKVRADVELIRSPRNGLLTMSPTS